MSRKGINRERIVYFQRLELGEWDGRGLGRTRTLGSCLYVCNQNAYYMDVRMHVLCGTVMGEGRNSAILETVHAYMGVHYVPVYVHECAVCMCVLCCVQKYVQCACLIWHSPWLRTKSHPLWKLCVHARMCACMCVCVCTCVPAHAVTDEGSGNEWSV